MIRRLALVALALCALAALEGCGGASSLMGPGTEQSPAGRDNRRFGGGQREGDPGTPGANPAPAYVDQGDTLVTASSDAL